MNEFIQFPCINTATMGMLRRNTASNPEILDELFENFIEDADELIKEIETTIKENEVDNYFTAVHTLKGLCGTIGCSQMFEVLKTMDKLKKDQDFENSVSYFNNLTECFQNTITAIRYEVLSKDNELNDTKQ